VGLLILYGAGWSGGAVLAAFFISSNLVSRVGSPGQPSDADAKSDRRDAWQVYANGGPAALAALLFSADLGLSVWLTTISLAAAASDTWATGLGSRSRVPPRMLWSARPVAPGTSGAVTLAGCVGAVFGAGIVSATGALAAGNPLLLPAGTLIGFFGMLVDSLIGGALQGRFHCARCNQPSEWRLHRCGNRTEWKSGWAWLNNDTVNFLATALATFMAWAAWHWLD
jgi:uncharacterized protein (TIGR00297 family)